MTSQSFPEFGEMVAKGKPTSFKEFGEIVQSQELKPTLLSVAPKTKTEEFMQHLALTGGKKFAGGLIGTPGDIVEFVQRIAGVKKPIQTLPTSTQVESFIEKLAGKRAEAETETGKLGETAASMLGGIFSLGGPLKAATTAGSMGRTAFAALLPAGALRATEKADLPPWMQAASAVGAGLLAHRMTGQSLNSIKEGLYNQASKLSEGKMVPASGVQKSLSGLEASLEKGVSTGPKTAVKGVASELTAKIKDGQIPLEDLLEAKKNITEKMGEFEKIKGSKGYFKWLGKAVDQGIQDYEKTDPAFKSVYRQANSLHKGMNEARTIERFLINHPVIGAEAGLILHLLAPIIMAGKGIPMAIIAKSGEFAVALARNQGLRKAYFDILKNASANELKATSAALKKFNQLAEKEGLSESD